MFATVLGGLPWPDEATSADDALLAVLAAQGQAGLVPLTDGRLWDPEPSATLRLLKGGEVGAFVARWERARAAAGALPVKRALPGPWSLAFAAGASGPAAAEPAVAIAANLRAVVLALASAGCPLVEIEETEAHRIGTDEPARAAFREAHRALT